LAALDIIPELAQNMSNGLSLSSRFRIARKADLHRKNTQLGTCASNGICELSWCSDTLLPFGTTYTLEALIARGEHAGGQGLMRLPTGSVHFPTLASSEYAIQRCIKQA
jgi:hypothetical protein